MALDTKRRLIRALTEVAETATNARDRIDAAALAVLLKGAATPKQIEALSPEMARLLEKGKA